VDLYILLPSCDDVVEKAIPIGIRGETDTARFRCRIAEFIDEFRLHTDITTPNGLVDNMKSIIECGSMRQNLTLITLKLCAWDKKNQL
jgi:hypothetical protein